MHEESHTDTLVNAVRASLPFRFNQWGLHVKSVSVQALTASGWPITVIVSDPGFDEPLKISFDKEPLQQDTQEGQVNSIVNVICALIDERLHAKDH